MRAAGTSEHAAAGAPLIGAPRAARTACMLEATGGPAACLRCGRPAPAQDDPAWGGRMHNGRLIALACPDCLTPEERTEIAGRGEATLWEVVPGRRAAPAELAGLADAEWLALLPPDVRVVGAVAHEGDPVRVAWVARTVHGAPTACLADVPLARWAALEEVFVPARARELARRFSAGRPAATP